MRRKLPITIYDLLGFTDKHKLLTASRRSLSAGFSLMEILLYLGIFSMLIVVLFQMLVSILDVQLSSKGHSAVDQDGLYILSRLTYDIRQASSIASPSAGQSAERLVLRIGSGDLIYSVATASLILRDAAGDFEDQVNSQGTEISDIQFIKRSDTQGKGFDAITAIFTVRSKAIVRGMQESKEFRTTVGLRRQ